MFNTRSVKLTRHESIDKFYILDSIKHKASIAALNQAGDILAVRLGTIYSSGDRGEKFFQNLMTWVFSFKAVSKRLPEPLQGMHHMLKFTKMADYNVWNMFDKLGTDKIYEAKGVCSARSHGIRGLGTELVRRSEILAVERGCTHVYAALTGNKTALRSWESSGIIFQECILRGCSLVLITSPSQAWSMRTTRTRVVNPTSMTLESTKNSLSVTRRLRERPP